MTPADIMSMAPLIAFLATACVVAIPVFALSARFAIRPIADAMVRIREAPAAPRAAADALVLQDRRLSLMEAELQHIQSSLERLVEADHFRTQLESARSTPALGQGPRVVD
jgi:hypothetical protein